jgi:hypothetical protein
MLISLSCRIYSENINLRFNISQKFKARKLLNPIFISTLIQLFQRVIMMQVLQTSKSIISLLIKEINDQNFDYNLDDRFNLFHHYQALKYD